MQPFNVHCLRAAADLGPLVDTRFTDHADRIRGRFFTILTDLNNHMRPALGKNAERSRSMSGSRLLCALKAKR
jgi:hypothetical protein